MIYNFTSTAQQKNQTPRFSGEESAGTYDMIVCCHLRWQFVYQRPQHIISRMAKTMKVLFIEEPMAHNPSEENTANLIKIHDRLHILQPKVKDISSILSILPVYVKQEVIPFGWFYSPSFVPLLKARLFETVVYDCMDELSLFKGASSSLIQDEKYLMEQADIVFTGGKSLYESKKLLHPNVYCFPSSVDEQHFAQALQDIEVPDDIAYLQFPIVGYFGVIDERIDLHLLYQAAQKMPNVSFVMIGPLAKIDKSDLPRAHNIYYLGMKSYAELPNYLKAFDIAMMPFALNDATKYISPTKTLEYIAAGKPIISTKIADVVEDYSSCISLIDTADEFCDAVELLLDNCDSLSMQAEYYEILKKTSWDTTVRKMKSIVKILQNETY